MMKRLKKLVKSEPLRIAVGLAIFIPALIIEHTGNNTLALALFITALILSGIEVFIDAVRGILRRDFLDEKFLMCIASVGAVIIGEAEEGVAVMLFFLVGEWFEHIAVRRSRNSIRSLMDIRPDTAHVLRDGVETDEDAEDVEVGELIIVRSGERIPIDSVVISGGCDVDNSALTGEAIPVGVGVGDTVSGGGIVLGGVITCRTLRTAEESAASRILELVENASERKSREESFITKFSRVYTPAVIALAALMAVVPSLFGWLEWTDAIYRALSFLVISCPCALVISVPMAFFGGIGGAASRGILYKGGNTFSPISRVKSVVFDKTGTLTVGQLTVSHVYVTDKAELDGEQMLDLAASAEYSSNHPIADGLRAAAKNIYPATDLSELAGRGVTAVVDGRTVAAGNVALLSELGLSVPEIPDGAVCVAIDGKYTGYIAFSDKVKPEAKEAIMRLRSLGAERIYILSGDRYSAARRVGEELGVDTVLAELMPEDKYERLEEIMSNTDGTTLYVGDGINDAPCLARADVGVAMGSLGSDSAIEAADAVIMSDNLMRLSDAVRIARRTLGIAKQNIVFAIGVKLLVLALVSVSLAGMWMAVFADVGVAVLAILNSMRTLYYK